MNAGPHGGERAEAYTGGHRTLQVIAMIGWNALVLLSAVTVTAPLPAPEQIMQTPAALQQQLQQQVILPSHSSQQRLQRLVQFVFSTDGLGLQYDPDATLSVTETFQQRRANCLSFTLLFVTLARQAGLKARVQEVGQVVTWYEDQGVIYIAGHVNAGLETGDRTVTVDLDSNVFYDQRGPRPISDQRALAHFYNNRGAALMAAGDLDGARAHYQMALQLDPRFIPGWNNLGVLNARQGDLNAATRDFDSALSINRNHAPTLSNASNLYRRMGDRRAEGLSMRLQRAQRQDPFYQFLRGQEAERGHDYAGAILHYRAAIKLYDNAPPFHFGLARAYFLIGNNPDALRQLQRARALAGSGPLRARYQAKIQALQRLSGGH